MVRQEIIEAAKSRLIDAYHPRLLYLFGSYAWGTPDEESDLDMLVVVDESSEKPHRRAVKGIEALMGLGLAKDIVVYTIEEFDRLSTDVSSLCHKVRTRGIKLYETV